MITNMKKARLGIFTGLALFLLPFISHAQTTDIAGLGGKFFDVINNVLIPLIFALAFLWFLWGVFQYVFFQNDDSGKEAARSNMIWGVIALFIMFSVWGLVRLLVNTADLESDAPTGTELPSVPETR